MLRRDFLKSTSAVAAAGLASGTKVVGAETPPAAGAPLGAPTVIARPKHEFVLTTPSPLELPGVGETARRIIDRIAAASNGAMRLVIDERPESPVELIATGQADFTFANEVSNRGHDPAFTFFGGMPGAAGLMPTDHASWLAGGGQVLWDELGASFGMKPLLVAHSGPQPGLWTRQPLGGANPLVGRAVLTRGVGNDAVTARGGRLVDTPAAAIEAALAHGTLDIVEWAGPFAALALGLDTHARHYCRGGIHPSGFALTLGIRRGLWDGLGAADRAIIEGCAALEWQATCAETCRNDARALAILSGARGVTVYARPAHLDRLLAEPIADRIAVIARTSPLAARIGVSHGRAARIAPLLA